MHFAEITKLRVGKKRHTLLCILVLFGLIVAYLSLQKKKRVVTPNFLFGS